eukprot:m.355243 g.355243  ORF g.355243 m.355243 type:complete len:275 (+) comp17206_c0_seq1:853-1677(+)
MLLDGHTLIFCHNLTCCCAVELKQRSLPSSPPPFPRQTAMKLLDNPDFARLAHAITGLHNNQRVVCRLESYSCKMAGQDKKLFKHLANTEGLDESHLLSPSPSSFQHSPSSPTDGLQTINQKMLYQLRATLNAAYAPEYDFSSAKAYEFSRAPTFDFAINNIAGNLLPVLGVEFDSISRVLWPAIQKEMDPADCEIYSYMGDSGCDPFTEEGSLWWFCYLFYSKRQKRMVMFASHAISNTAPIQDVEDMDDLPDDFLFQESMEYSDNADLMDVY